MLSCSCEILIRYPCLYGSSTMQIPFQSCKRIRIIGQSKPSRDYYFQCTSESCLTSVVNTEVPRRNKLRAVCGCDRTHEPQFGNCIRLIPPMHVTSANQIVLGVALFARGGEPSRTDSGHLDLVQLATLLGKS